MISRESFTVDWINRKRQEKKYSKVNPPIIEKMIHALGLLEALVRQGLAFIFKGGTALVILLDEPKRFSVDIDIITNHTRDELEAVLTAVVGEGLFTRWELDGARSYQGRIPKAHYFLYYRSNLNVATGYVLLDVLFEKHRYAVVAGRSITSSWVSVDGEALQVETPSIDSILGDKLTAFAPRTTGVPYGRNKSLEIVKQMHDVGHLFDHIKDLKVISKTFQAIVDQEVTYRGLTVDDDHVLDDIIGTSFMIGRAPKNHTAEEIPKYAEISRGMVQFRGYLMTGTYSLDHAVESAAKAAYLAAKLKIRNFDPVERYDGQVIDFQFKSPPHNMLNRLRNIRTGSLYYWSKTASCLGLE
jgi:predicted nucleotidyltransferase component of viral defense system